MRVRLIDEDEPPTVLRVGETEIDVRRVPESKRREFQAVRRREIRRLNGNVDPDAMARFLQGVEDDCFDYSITGWRHMDGDPPCTRENKLRLPPSVCQAVNVLSGNAGREQATAEAEADRNFGLPSGSSDSSAAATATASS